MDIYVPKFKPYCGGFDFEPAFFESGKTAFPGMLLIGCLFHFKKADREKMEKLGIPDNEIKIAMEWGALDLLNVLPQNELKEKVVTFVKVMLVDKCFEYYREEGEVCCKDMEAR